MDRFKRMDSPALFVLKEIAGPTLSTYDGPVCPGIALNVANEAHKLQNPQLAALALRMDYLLDCKTMQGINLRPAVLLSMTAPAPADEVKQRGRVTYDELSWALQSSDPSPVDLLTRQGSARRQPHRSDRTPILPSVADYSAAHLHATYYPVGPALLNLLRGIECHA
jgi:hypothetical protein